MQLTVKEQVWMKADKSPSFILPMDVRAKHRLSYQRRPLNFSLRVAVSPHVISAVGSLVFGLWECLIITNRAKKLFVPFARLN